MPRVTLAIVARFVAESGRSPVESAVEAAGAPGRAVPTDGVRHPSPAAGAEEAAFAVNEGLVSAFCASAIALTTLTSNPAANHLAIIVGLPADNYAPIPCAARA
jgi:hypothetical protein